MASLLVQYDSSSSEEEEEVRIPEQEKPEQEEQEQESHHEDQKPESQQISSPKQSPEIRDPTLPPSIRFSSTTGLPETVVGMKLIPETTVALVLTSQNYEFYYDLFTKESFWEPGEDVRMVLDMLVAEVEMERLEREAEVDMGMEELEEEIEQGRKRTIEDLEDEEGENDTQHKKLKVTDAEPTQDLPEEERNRLFKELLAEKNVSPVGLWDIEESKIMNDERYALIKSLKDRQTLFNEYCNERIKEVSMTKTPKDKFRELLEENLKSFKTTWDDFQRRWKRDPRFSMVTIPKERERLFREFAEKMRKAETEKLKRQQAKAREAFKELLRETKEVQPNSLWRDIKPLIESNPRYKAIISPTERETLFNEYLKELNSTDKESDKKRREEESLRARQEQVRRERESLLREQELSKSSFFKEDAILAYRSLLIDLVRQPDERFSNVIGRLERDSRWKQCERLDKGTLLRCFDEHMDGLFQKRLDGYHQALEELYHRTLKLDMSWSRVIEKIEGDTRVSRFSNSESVLRKEWDMWLKEFIEKKRDEFQQMLVENKYVNFTIKQRVADLEAQSAEKGEVDADGYGKWDIGEVWEKVDIDEIRRVLSDDTRYLIFSSESHKHERDRMLMGYLLRVVEESKKERYGSHDMTIARHASSSSTFTRRG